MGGSSVRIVGRALKYSFRIRGDGSGFSICKFVSRGGGGASRPELACKEL
jgi:hypothetical protein